MDANDNDCEVAVSNLGACQEEADRKARKRSKKKAKQVEESVDDPSAEQSKKKKKKKKKDKKERHSADEESNPCAISCGMEDKDLSVKKKKKKKKNKRPAPSDDDAPESVSADSGCPEPHIAPPSPSKKRKLSVSLELPSDVALWREKNQIKLIGEDVIVAPCLSFQQAGFPSNVMGGCEGFTQPTPIQAQCWPILQSGRDLIGVAETGSGKTLAFALPGLARIVRNSSTAKLAKQAQSPLILVVAPTRELAQQCAAVFAQAASSAGLLCCCVYGGVPKHEQKRQLRGAHAVVATPGRLKDLMQEGAVSLGLVEYLVLDEADRMLDLGFEQDMREIISATSPERQTAMFSATWPMEVRKLAMEFLKDPIRVTIGGSKLAANVRVSQAVQVVEERDRPRLLREVLRKYHNGKNRVIVFGLYKKECARLEEDLRRDGWKCGAIHGDKSQEAREQTLAKFKENSVPLLIATDVAARGLDIPDVEVVINYSFPLTIEDYVHRIGRTGRAGKSGISHTFFHDGDKARAGELVNVLNKANAQIPPELLKYGTHVKKKEHNLYGAFSKDVDLTKKATKIVFDDDSDS